MKTGIGEITMKTIKTVYLTISSTVLLFGSQSLMAACNDVPQQVLENAIIAAESAGTDTGGYGLPMWVTMVDETGKVCHVATSGTTGAGAGNTQWLGSRVISAQKANTANAFSLDGYAISTANLYSAVQPGGSLYGLQHSNPVDSTRAYAGSPNAYGTNRDPLRNRRIGGVNVFGGGLALYSGGKKIGAIGVSGDTSCRDHAYAWRVRTALDMHPSGTGISTVNLNADGVVQAPIAGATVGDEMILTGSGGYWDAWSQPACPNSTDAVSSDNGTLQAP